MDRELLYGNCLKHLRKISQDTIDLVVTSPPYNSGQEYEENMTDIEYGSFIAEVFSLLKRVLKRDGRICWIIAPTISRKNVEFPFPLEYITMKAAKKASLCFWETIIWNQLHSEAQTSWGSWQSASAPFIRHQTERILLFVKQTRKRLAKGESSLFKKGEFEKATLDIWDIKPDTKKGFHPCPFPLDLALRCVKLFSYVNDIILDPFMGSGTTGEACKQLNRVFIGIEKEKNYFKLAKTRLISLDDYFEKTEVI